MVPLMAHGAGVVNVAGGRVRGREGDGIWCFAGIPYASAPEGALRWRPPQPPAPWKGVRDAHEPGPIAPQAPALSGLSFPGDPTRQSEDCLSLNVWAPVGAGGERPVMIFVHGGGFTTGLGASMLYDGSHLARAGGVVVVSFNYRLGALGFLAHPDLTESHPAGRVLGNWGLLDQIAALRWVKDNISAFGGEPRNVTLFGESAGAMSVAALLAAPAARGLFHRVVMQSGPPYTQTPDRALRTGEDLAKELGVVGADRAVWESIPADELVAATQVLQTRRPDPGELPLPFLPVVDGAFLPQDPLRAVAAGAVPPVPMIVGTNRDELTLFVFSDPSLAGIDEEGLVRWVCRAVPTMPSTLGAEVVIDSYRSARACRGEPTGPRELLVAIGSDIIFRLPSLRWATAHRQHQERTFVYLFTWETPAFGGQFGAAHGLELPFVFGALANPFVTALAGDGSDAEKLSNRMQQAWLGFARDGTPGSGDGTTWPAWDPGARPTMVFGPVCGPVLAPRDEELSSWSPAAPTQSGSQPSDRPSSCVPGT